MKIVVYQCEIYMEAENHGESYQLRAIQENQSSDNEVVIHHFSDSPVSVIIKPSKKK